MFPFVISLEWCDGILKSAFRRNSCASLIVALFFCFFLLKRCFPFTMSCRDLAIEHFGNGDSSSFMRKRLVMLERKTGLITFHEQDFGVPGFCLC